MMFEHVAIVGVGLIGGSFALAARRAGLARLITGWGGHSVEKALENRIIDDVERSFEKGRTCGADLVYLAAPVGGIIDFLESRGGLIKEGAIVTDAGSTKRRICHAALRGLKGRACFIGGHPMAGSHKTGVDFATADLFRGAAYAVMQGEHGIESEGRYAKAMNSVIETVRAIGATPILTTPGRHDRIVARTSHAPQLLATALALAVEMSGVTDEARLTGSGLAEMTRLAESRWSVWKDICRTNADEIGLALGEVMDQMDRLRGSLEAGEYADVGEAFERANAFKEIDRSVK